MLKALRKQIPMPMQRDIYSFTNKDKPMILNPTFRPQTQPNNSKK